MLKRCVSKIISECCPKAYRRYMKRRFMSLYYKGALAKAYAILDDVIVNLVPIQA
jgi:hypothetical protein